MPIFTAPQDVAIRRLSNDDDNDKFCVSFAESTKAMRSNGGSSGRLADAWT